jgi:nucleoside-diphosphate-sugar epimerase
VNKGLGKDVKPIFAPAREGEMARACADCTKAKKVLGYRVNYSFEHGLKETLDWLKQGNR